MEKSVKLAEIILKEMAEKKLTQMVLAEALDIIKDKFFRDATI